MMTFITEWPLSNINMKFILIFKTLRFFFIDLKGKGDSI